MRNEVNADDFNKQILNLLENPKLSISKICLHGQVGRPLTGPEVVGSRL